VSVAVRALPALLHQGRSAGLRALLRGTTPANVRQRSAQPAAELARAASDQVQEAFDAADHVHGRQHQDVAGRLGDNCQGALSAVVRADWLEGPVRLFTLYRSL